MSLAVLEARVAAGAAMIAAAAAQLPELVDGMAEPWECAVLAASVAGGLAAVRARRLRLALADIAAYGERAGRGDPPSPRRAFGPELQPVAETVAELSGRLAREEHARAAFIGRVSHELRTPITVIKGYAYTLQRAQPDPVTASKLDVINAECEHLAYLVEDLLELSRAQAGELRISSELFPIRTTVEEVAQRLRPVAEDRHVRIELDWSADGACVMGDENRMRQIFANLLTNGIKYAPAGSSVRIRGEEDGQDVVVSVTDAGRGIAEGDLPHIFDEFFQAPERSEPGAGLGLAIARELTEAHGGSIAVESRVGEGSTFRVRLPAWAEA
jgi:two-component system sensor histidine kinase BaeS